MCVTDIGTDPTSVAAATFKLSIVVPAGVVVETLLFFCFFFFQAEDGIRDADVTGVQTCALPIYLIVADDFAAIHLDDEIAHHSEFLAGVGEHLIADDVATLGVLRGGFSLGGVEHRSEERRVGKECRSRWSRVHYKKGSGGELCDV